MFLLRTGTATAETNWTVVHREYTVSLSLKVDRDTEGQWTPQSYVVLYPMYIGLALCTEELGALLLSLDCMGCYFIANYVLTKFLSDCFNNLPVTVLNFLVEKRIVKISNVFHIAENVLVYYKIHIAFRPFVVKSWYSIKNQVNVIHLHCAAHSYGTKFRSWLILGYAKRKWKLFFVVLTSLF